VNKSRSKAIARNKGRTRYKGKVCAKHVEAKGERYVAGGTCPYCAMKKVADYRATLRGRINVLANWRRRAYNISTEQFDTLLASQANRCAICRTDKAGGRDNTWHLDHDHTTKAVRGILCAKCNSGLGFFEDSIALLSGAVNYLAKFV
jgi:hypothetical protein